MLRDQEDDRLGYALALTLTRPELTADTAVAWLDRIAAAFENGESGPVPAYAGNTMRTLRSLYVFADRGLHVRGQEGVVTLPQREAVKERIGQVLRITFPGVP